jgi:protein-L-isoaspartate(D-aspartate) O-methyltransferase
MKNIYQKFSNQTLVELSKIFFSYNGQARNALNETQSFYQMASSNDKTLKKMVVVVCDHIIVDGQDNYESALFKSKIIICPKCNNEIKMNIKNYRVNLFDCKNGHIINNLSLKEFEKSQYINHEFFRCLDCNNNLCDKCIERYKEDHDDHNVIEYDKKYYICTEHNEYYTYYCTRCKKNICISCDESHRYHDKISFGKIMSNKTELQNKLKTLKEYVDKFNKDYKEIIKVINEVKQNFDLYYNIKKEIIENFNNTERYYELLINLKEISNNDDIIKDINQVNDQKNILNKFKSILNIYNNMQSNSTNKIIIIEEVNQKYITLEKENEKMKSKISELESTIKKNESNQNTVLLIKKLIEAGMDNNTRICNKYTEGNKRLLTELIIEDFITSEKVTNVMLEVDRQDFAPVNHYVNRPQYLGYNVTISAPHMHAFALECLSNYCVEGAKILDVGSGSGYLTVALSKMTNDTGTVVGIEHIPELYLFGVSNVKKKHANLIEKGKIIFVKGDGRKGCKEYAPYKAIHVGAASEQVPRALIDQLDYGGRIFIPVGPKGESQNIYLVDKDLNGEITCTSILSVRYGMLTDVETQLQGK